MLKENCLTQKVHQSRQFHPSVSRVFPDGRMGVVPLPPPPYPYPTNQTFDHAQSKEEFPLLNNNFHAIAQLRLLFLAAVTAPVLFLFQLHPLCTHRQCCIQKSFWAYCFLQVKDWIVSETQKSQMSGSKIFNVQCIW